MIDDDVTISLADCHLFANPAAKRWQRQKRTMDEESANQPTLREEMDHVRGRTEVI
jgi:hypothetical protein